MKEEAVFISISPMKGDTCLQQTWAIIATTILSLLTIYSTSAVYTSAPKESNFRISRRHFPRHWWHWTLFFERIFQPTIGKNKFALNYNWIYDRDEFLKC